MDDIEKAYECIFDFDTENKLINAYTSEDVVKDTDIILSFHNLIKNVKIEQTSKVAIGEVKNSSGNDTTYGISADLIAGKILAGNQLTITNENNSFTLNGSGATLKNATLILESGNSRILQNPKDGFKIQKRSGNTWKVQFYADSNGNLNMLGKMNISSNSNIGGLQITENSIRSSNENIVLEINGNAKIGALFINGNNARFDGTIRANRIEGQITNN